MIEVVEKDKNMNQDQKKENHTAVSNEVESQTAGEPPVSRFRLIHVISGRRWLVIAVVLIAVSGIALTLFLSRGSSSPEGRPVPAPSGEPVPAPPGDSASGTQPHPGEITITLTPEKLESTDIKTETAIAQAGTPTVGGGLRTTGTVQSNAYKEVPILPIAGGITREVNAQLGDKVKRGQALATIFSTELANAQGDYLKMLAELEEHHKHHGRSIELAEIGAISREELDEATSKYKSAQANVSSAKQRLMLLGMSAKEVEALRTADQVRSIVSVPSPVSGTVISRTVNPGEVVATGKEVFRVADLSTVWVMGQVYESDFAKAHVGTPVVITTAAYPGRTFAGRVAYIDPRVDPQTRTAQLRIEVANPGEILRIGMFVDVNFGGVSPAAAIGQPAVLVPRAAVQSIGTKQVVFVATAQPGVFIQREVTVGPETNGLATIYSGVSAGERVVTEGSFLLRAESLKLNPAQSASSIAPSAAPRAAPIQAEKSDAQPQLTGQHSAARMQTARVVLAKDAYRPSAIKFRKDIPVQLIFVRAAEVTCGTEVLIPDFNIKRELPLNEPVVLEFTPNKAGEISFACGMGMLRGKIIVR